MEEEEEKKKKKKKKKKKTKTKKTTGTQTIDLFAACWSWKRSNRWLIVVRYSPALYKNSIYNLF